MNTFKIDTEDLYFSEQDKEHLFSLSEFEREMILADRYENVLSRMENDRAMVLAEYYPGIKEQIHRQIWSDLVIGRSDEGFAPWTDQAINQFIEEHSSIIQSMAREISVENQDPVEDDCIREYLYENIDMDIRETDVLNNSELPSDRTFENYRRQFMT